MTEEEFEIEFRYRLTERLGILCGSDKPTPEQIELAHDEALKEVEELRKES